MTSSAQTKTEDSAVHLLISSPAGDKIPEMLKQQLADLDKSGLTSNVLFLEKKGSENGDGFESFAIVDFLDEDAYLTWRDNGGQKLHKSLRVRRADIMGHDAAPLRDSNIARFVVSSYESKVSRAGYQRYTDDYIVPNMMNQRWSGTMSRWTMYFEREVTGEKADAVLVMEYFNGREYARRAEPKQAYKEVLLKHHPKWAHINSVKDAEIRVGLTETYAEKVQLD